MPNWLAVDGLLSLFGEGRDEAQRNYRRFMLEGMNVEGQEDIWEGLKQQIYLGDEQFVERVQRRVEIRGDALTIPHRS